MRNEVLRLEKVTLRERGVTQLDNLNLHIFEGEILGLVPIDTHGLTALCDLLRENLSAIEEAEGFNRLINEFSHTHEALSQIVGKSRSYITNTLRLLSLPAAIQEMVKNNTLTAGHARALIGLENAEDVAQKIISRGLTVRQTEELVNNLKNHALSQISRAVKKDPSLKELEKDLTKNIGMKVKINAGQNDKGKVTIEYKSPAELNQILDLLEKNKS